MSRFDLHSEPPMGTKFHERYKHALVKENLVAYRPVIPSMLKGRLELNVDVIDRNDLLVLLHTLVNDNTLSSVSFESHLLRDNPQLTHDIMKLHYHSNIRLPVYADPEIMSSMCNALYRHLIKNEWCLTVLRLMGIPMTEKHLSTVTAAFPAAKTLKILSLEGMPLYAKHISVLLSSLPQLSSLIILNLSSCGFDKKLIAQLCPCIKDNCRLERLILNSNPIGDGGVAELANALTGSSQFRALDLQNCGITSTGCQHLIQLLYSNRCIEVCDIRRNTAIPREIALEIAKIMLENNKNYSKQTCYRPLQLTTTAPISVDDLPTSVPYEKPGVHLPPKDVPSVKLPSQMKAREPLSSTQLANANESGKSTKDGIFISEDFAVRLETSLIKFQVLLDYFELERKNHSAEITEKSREQTRRSRSKNTDKEHAHPEHTSVTSEHSKNRSRAENSKSHSASVTSQSEHANEQAKSASLSAHVESELSEKYSESFVSSKVADVVAGVPGRQENQSTTSSSKTASRQNTIKQTSTKSKKSSPESDVDDESVLDTDVTITSDNAEDSFGMNLASIEGITKRSSYLEIANEIYEDPHILESTRASAVVNDDSLALGRSRRSSSSRTDTNIEGLEERLRIIKSKYNEIELPLHNLGAAVESAAGTPGNKVLSRNSNNVKPLKVDDVSISDSWVADALGESNDRSLNSIPTSYSGNLSGSDLDDF